MAPSSSGLGRRPLKAEVEGSNPFGATMNIQNRPEKGGFFSFEAQFTCRRECQAFRADLAFCGGGVPSFA